jgi:hypothetical protein
MSQLLAQVAVKIWLDGVRVGLEDGLAVSDLLVLGKIRKGSTAGQARNLSQELERLGCYILSVEENSPYDSHVKHR